nr:Transposase, mutator type [Methylocystis sp. SC2]
MARRKEPKIPDAVLDQLLAGADAKTAFDPNGLLDELKKALAERGRRSRRSCAAARVDRQTRRRLFASGFVQEIFESETLRS